MERTEEDVRRSPRPIGWLFNKEMQRQHIEQTTTRRNRGLELIIYPQYSDEDGPVGA